MNTQTRKQREIQEREARILEVASHMLGEVGYLGVTMDRIAEAIDYSKGTVYQHFRNKEELLLALVKHRKDEMVHLFRRAAAFEGTTRERMTAVGEAYILFTRLYPVEFRHLPTLLSPSIYDKVAPDRCQEVMCQDQQCMEVVTQVVEEAVAGGDLTLPDTMTPIALVFGLWSTIYGALTLMQTTISFGEMGLDDPFSTLTRTLQAMLDGVGWHPLSPDFDLDALRSRIRNEVFPEEFAVLDNPAGGNRHG